MSNKTLSDEALECENCCGTGRVTSTKTITHQLGKDEVQAEDWCEYCGGSGDVHNIIGEWLGVCSCECGDAIRTEMEAKP